MRKRTSVLSLILLMVLALLVGGFVLIRRGFSARETPSHVEVYVARTVRRLAIPATAKNAINPFTATPQVLEEARVHFADHCALCHANNGSGLTTIGQSLYPKTPDLRLPATQGLSDGEIYYIIQNGIRLTGMPAWGDAHEDEDSWKLVLFIRHLPRLAPEEEKEMEKFNPKSAAERTGEEKFLRGEEPKKEKHRPHH